MRASLAVSFHARPMSVSWTIAWVVGRPSVSASLWGLPEASRKSAPLRRSLGRISSQLRVISWWCRWRCRAGFPGPTTGFADDQRIWKGRGGADRFVVRSVAGEVAVSLEGADQIGAGEFLDADAGARQIDGGPGIGGCLWRVGRHLRRAGRTAGSRCSNSMLGGFSRREREAGFGGEVRVDGDGVLVAVQQVAGDVGFRGRRPRL